MRVSKKTFAVRPLDGEMRKWTGVFDIARHKEAMAEYLDLDVQSTEYLLYMLNEDELFSRESFPAVCHLLYDIQQKDGGGMDYFVMHPHQRAVCDEIIKQFKKTGNTHIVLPKGRQTGASTLCAILECHIGLHTKVRNGERSGLRNCGTVVHIDKAREILLKCKKKCYSLRLLRLLYTRDTGMICEEPYARLHDWLFAPAKRQYMVSTIYGHNMETSVHSDREGKMQPFVSSQLHSLHCSEAYAYSKYNMAKMLSTLSGQSDKYVVVESSLDGRRGCIYELMDECGFIDYEAANKGASFYQSRTHAYMFIFLKWIDDVSARSSTESIPDEWEPYPHILEHLEANNIPPESLDREQLHWINDKVGRGTELQQRQLWGEYPCCLDDAVASAEASTFFQEEACRKALKRAPLDIAMLASRYNKMPSLVMGIDLGYTTDKIAIACLCGFYDEDEELVSGNVFHLETLRHSRAVGREYYQIIFNRVVELSKQCRLKPAVVNVDLSEAGGSVNVGHFHELAKEYKYFIDTEQVSLEDVFVQATFGRSSNEKMDANDYTNHRGRMYSLLRKSIDAGSIKLPDDTNLEAELTSILATEKSGKFTLEEKAALKKRLRHSPDRMDACALLYYSLPFGLKKQFDFFTVEGEWLKSIA